MPSTSRKQARFMAAAAHNPKFAKEAGIPVSVAKEFNRADQRRNAIKRAIRKVRNQQ
jgi:ribonuclease P protein component